MTGLLLIALGLLDWTFSYKEIAVFEDFLDNQLHSKTTELCRIMAECGSDKATSHRSSHHNYTTFYHYLLKDFKNSFEKVFELGLGTNNANIPSNMSGGGTPCGSLRGWKGFFPNAHVYGADIDRDILYQEDRISTYYCNQLDPLSIASLWSNFDFKFNLIVEDGLHTFEANKCFFENSSHMVAPGGFFIIEDILNRRIPMYDSILQLARKSFSYAEIIIIPNPSNPANNPDSDNTVLVARK